VVHSTSVTVDAMRGKLLTLDDVRERVGSTEPLATYPFDATTDVRFRLNPGWNHGADTRKETDVVDALVSVGGSELQLTQGALYEAMGLMGMPKGMGTEFPPELVEPMLNYWFRGGAGDDKSYKVLSTNNRAAAITRASVKPYSNLELIDRVLQGIEAKYGEGEVLVDYKFTHNLERTHARFIVPEYRRDIVNSGTDNDTWSVGIDFRNSLIGKEQTAISGYLFRWWCTNGAIDTLNDAGTWSRRGQAGQSEEVYEWARDAVDEVLGGLESSLDLIQNMTEMNLQGHTVDVLDDYFTKYKVPTKMQDVITSALVDEDTLTMYSLMQAFTQAANDTDMDPKQAARLMRVGGDIAAGANNRCDSCYRSINH
jgi:hypothetical protein